MKETAVGQFEQGFFSYAEPFSYFSEEDKWVITEKDFLKLIQQAKEMERQQILDAVDWGNRKGYDEHILTIVYDLDEQYYNQTFKSK
jgi:hypothetical protein